jgi:hypothetical protein
VPQLRHPLLHQLSACFTSTEVQILTQRLRATAATSPAAPAAAAAAAAAAAVASPTSKTAAAKPAAAASPQTPAAASPGAAVLASPGDFRDPNVTKFSYLELKNREECIECQVLRSTSRATCAGKASDVST